MTWMWLAIAAAQESVLDDEAFRFCHEYAAFEYNDAFCNLIQDVDPTRCPGLHAYCAAPAEAPASGCQKTRRGGVLGSHPSDEVPEPESPPFNPFALSGSAQEGAKALLSWLVALIVAGVLVGVAAVVLRFIGFRRLGNTPSATRALPDKLDEQSFAEAVDDVPDLPSEDLLRAARQALVDGRLGEASLLARGAVLRSLGERRLLRLHRARTDREYLAQLPVEDRALLRDVLSVVEVYRWGRVPLHTAGVERALKAATKLLVLSLFLCMSPAWGFDRHGPAGDVGLHRLLKASGATVSYRGRSFSELDPESDLDILIIDLSGTDPTDEDWIAIRAWVEAGHVLWVAGMPQGFPELGNLVPTEQAESQVVGLPTPHFEKEPNGFTVGVPVVSDGTAHPVVWTWVGVGGVLAFADRTMLWNGFLVDPANEEFLAGMLDFGRDGGWPMADPPTIELATIAGSADPPPPTAMANLRLLPFIYQVLFLWLVMVVWKGWPFRRNRTPPEHGRQRFDGHVRAVASQYRRVGASKHVAASYARWVLQKLGREGLALQAQRHGLSVVRAEQLVEHTITLAETEEGYTLEHMEDLWKVMQTER